MKQIYTLITIKLRPFKKLFKALRQKIFFPLFAICFFACNTNSIPNDVIADFEDKIELLEIKTINSEIALSESHVNSGKFSLKISFHSNQSGVSSVILGESFLSKKKCYAAYKFIQISVFNPAVTQERLLIQLKDSKGNRYKQEALLSAVQGDIIRIPIETLSKNIDLKHITELTLFLWKPDHEREFYIDNIKLVKNII